MPKSTTLAEESRRKVLALRDKGLSLRKIAAELGGICSYETIRKVIKAHENGEPLAEPLASIPERKFAVELAKGKDCRAAARAAGIRGKERIDQFVQDAAANPFVRDTLMAAAERAGYGKDATIELMKDGLQATKHTIFGEVPDEPVRQRARERFWDLHRDADQLQNDRPQAQRHEIVVMTAEQAERFKVFTGGKPLPDSYQILDADAEPPEVADDAEPSAVDGDPDDEVVE